MNRLLIILIFLSCFAHYAVAKNLEDSAKQILSFINELKVSTESPGRVYCQNCSQKDYSFCEVAGVSRTWLKNCKGLLNNKKTLKGLPRNALEYALKTLKVNETSFKSDNCYNFAPKGHYSLNGLTRYSFENHYMKNGISNKCQMIINNLDQRVRVAIKKDGKVVSTKCRMNSYYIDLCSDNRQQIITKTVSSIGLGTCLKGNGFENKSGLGTTVLGSFVTGKLFNFKPKSKKHEDLREQLGGTIPAVALFGLNRSNSNAAKNYKYLHVDKFMSNGCVVLSKKDSNLIQKISQNGPALVVNYKQGSMEDILECSK